MKKKFLFFIMACMTALCSACTYEDFDDFISDDREVNVVVGGVDGGILNGARVCECGQQYAYYDDGVLYYFENKDSEPKTIQCMQPSQIAMNEDYIYYCQGQLLAAIDLKTMEQHNVYSNNEYIKGINVYSDEVLVVTEDENLHLHVYTVSGLEVNDADESKDYVDFDDFLSAKNHCANEYGSEVICIFLNGKKFASSFGYFVVREVGKEQEGKVYANIPDAVVTPEHMVEYEGKIYFLIQQTGSKETSDNNPKYMYKDWDEIICVDMEAETYESIYKTPGHQEQIVNFSIENNEMYLLVDGILYKSDLKGEQREELANYVGSKTLTFEYANDTLFVYDGYKLLGKYK